MGDASLEDGVNNAGGSMACTVRVKRALDCLRERFETTTEIGRRTETSFRLVCLGMAVRKLSFPMMDVLVIGGIFREVLRGDSKPMSRYGGSAIVSALSAAWVGANVALASYVGNELRLAETMALLHEVIEHL